MRAPTTDAARCRAGRKPKHPSGEVMKTRHIRMTDAQWADAQLVGGDAIRAYVTKRAKALKP